MAARSAPGTALSPASLMFISTTLMFLYAHLLEGFGLFAEGANTLSLMAVLTAATASSIAGFAFSAICAGMLLPLIQEPVQVVRVLLLSSIAIQSLSVWTLRHALDWRALWPFLLGGIIGLPMGIYLLLHIEAAAYVRLLGLLLILYGGTMLFRKPVTLRSRPIHDMMVGILGGITGGLAAFPGALVTIWCSMKGWDKAHQRGVYQPFILIMQILALLMIQVSAPTPGLHLGATAWTFVPPALLGTCCGLAIFKRLTDWQFATAINLLLIASGLGLAF